jgi:Integrase core domain
MRGDAGSSRLLLAQVHEDFHAETAFEVVVQAPRVSMACLPCSRWIVMCGSRRQRDPARFSFCTDPIPVLHWCPAQCPSAPSRLSLNCYVERYNKTYKKEYVEIFRPAALAEIRTVTEAFRQHYTQERPHQGRRCRNHPPAVVHPVLPACPALPATVDPDRWLTALDGRCYPRGVKRDGRIQVDGTSYYSTADLAGHPINANACSDFGEHACKVGRVLEQSCSSQLFWLP